MADEAEFYATNEEPKPLWIRPADHPGDGPVSTPKSVLLEIQAYIDDERNATTAEYVSKDGKRIQVTFWLAHPPGVSYFTVHCDGVKPAAFRRLPKVLATNNGLALLRLPAHQGKAKKNRDPIRDRYQDRFFIYHSTGTDGPWLRLLPKPRPCSFFDNEVGLLTDGDGFFLAVVFPVPLKTVSDLSYISKHRYLHLFDSKTWKWSTKLVYIDSPKSCSNQITHKVITIGGEHGSIGWVNLWHGILIYDVLLDNTVLRYVPLPSVVPPCFQDSPNSIGDIAVVDSCIKYFFMYQPTNQTTYIARDWQAEAWRMKDGPQEDWQQDCHFRASEIVVDNPRHFETLPVLPETVPKRSILTMFHIDSPVLSLHDDGVVYVMIKTHYLDQKAWVLAIDLNTKALKGVVEFGPTRTIHYNYTYTQSEISKHMGVKVSDQSEEDLWIQVSKKNKSNWSYPRPEIAGCRLLLSRLSKHYSQLCRQRHRPGPEHQLARGDGDQGKLLSQGVAHLGAGSRGEPMGLDHGPGSGVSGAGTARGPRRLFGISAFFAVWLGLFSLMFILPVCGS